MKPSFHHRSRARTMPVFAVAAFLLGGLPGCDGTDPGGLRPITEVRTLGPDTPRSRGVGPDVRRFFGDPRASAPGSGTMAAPTGIAWDLPPGWVEKPPAEFRDGNFGVPAHPDLECTITVSPGDGGGVAANLDRWRRQMGLAPLGEGELDALPRVPVMGGNGPLLDVRGTFGGMGGGAGREGWRLLGTVRTLPMASVFVKMTGPEAAVAAERTSFLALLSSLRLGAAPSAPPEPDSPEPAPAFRWEVPEGWTVGREGPFRLVTLHPPGSTEAECYVSLLGGDGGGLLANMNRWRDQMGLSPLDEAALAALPTIPFLGDPVPLLECDGAFAGMEGGDGRSGYSLYGVAHVLEGGAVFVKFTGPSEVLRARRDEFIAFCGSLRR